MLPVRSGASPLHPTRLRRAAEAGVSCLGSSKGANLQWFSVLRFFCFVPRNKSVCVVSFLVHCRWRLSFVFLSYIATPASAIVPLSTLGWVHCLWRSSPTFIRKKFATPVSATPPSLLSLAVSLKQLVGFFDSVQGSSSTNSQLLGSECELNAPVSLCSTWRIAHRKWRELQLLVWSYQRTMQL